MKLLQRRAQPASKRLRASVRQTLDDAAQEAEAVRGDARAEAVRIRASAEAEAAQLCARARQDADELLHRAGQTAAQAHGPQPREGESLHTRASAAGVGGRLRRQGRDLVLRPALRPLATATAVAGLALAAMLAGDSLTGTPGTCQAGQTQTADQLIPRADFQGRKTVQQAAFALKPGDIIYSKLPAFSFPTAPSSSASADTPPTPTPSTAPTPSPTPTPSTSPTPTPTPTPNKPDPCAPPARDR